VEAVSSLRIVAVAMLLTAWYAVAFTATTLDVTTSAAFSITSITVTPKSSLLYPTTGHSNNKYAPLRMMMEPSQSQQTPLRNGGIRQRRFLSSSNLKANEKDNDDTTTGTSVQVVVERPDPSILLSSQSDTIQQLGIVGIVSALGIGTYGIIQVLTLLEQILPYGWYATWRDYTWPIPFGLIFITAGVAHFTMKETFTAMVPPKNTWGGLWQIPTPFIESISSTLKTPLSYAEYHVYWSGIAEASGGLLLIISFFFPNIIPVTIPAFLIFLLLICVTPANIYMATHDIQAPNLPPIPYPSGHIGRGILQCILLSMFWKLALP
jgi:uncharacterized membrane protein